MLMDKTEKADMKIAQASEIVNAVRADTTVSDVLGQLTWLMTQAKEFKGLFLSDLEWLLMPAIIMKQFRVFNDEKTQRPRAAYLWASVSDDVLERVGGAAVPRLNLKEWRSGPNLIVVAAIVPGGDQAKAKAAFLEELQARAADKKAQE